MGSAETCAEGYVRDGQPVGTYITRETHVLYNQGFGGHLVRAPSLSPTSCSAQID
jgi:hypothetical protein